MTSSMPTRRTAVTAVLAGLTLSACSSTKKGSDAASSGGEDVMKRLKAAQDAMAKTAGYHVTVTSSGVPSAEQSLKAGAGDVSGTPAAFKGDVTASAQGNEIKAGVVSIGKEDWVKPSFSPKYMKLNLASLGVPSPAALFDPKAGLPALPTMSTDMKRTGEKLVSGEKVTTFKGSVEGPVAAKALGFGKSRNAYTVEVGLTDKNEMRSMVIAGPFFDSADATYTIGFSDFGKQTSITKP